MQNPCAGELSPGVAWALCVGLAVAGVSIVAANFGGEITLLYSLGLFLGTIYRCAHIGGHSRDWSLAQTVQSASLWSGNEKW